MNKLYYLRWLLTLLLGLGSLSAAQASHFKGGEITYASIPSTTAGVPRYHIVIRNFVTTNNIAVANTAALTASRGGCGATGTNTFTVQAPMTQTVNCPQHFCSQGNPSGLSAYVAILYEIDLDLPAGEWTLSNTGSARSADTQNITSSLNQNYYISAYLDNTVVVQDSSPKFESVLMPYFNAGALAPHSFATFDADGDSLRYELILPYSLCGQTVPSTFIPHFTLDASTGAFVPAPASTITTQGYYNVTVRVSEYRRLGARWVLIGSVMRDILYLAQASTDHPPTFTSVLVNGSTPSAPPLIRPGQTVQATLQATDPDAGTMLHFVSEAPNVIPGLTMTPVGTASVQLTWQVPATLPAGRYTIAVAVLDDECGYNESEERSLTFVVGGQPLATRASRLVATDVYPVPFRDQVQFKTAPNQAVVLVDALGREVAHLASQADGVVRWQPAAGLPAGLYLACSAADGQLLARLLRAGN